MEDFFAAEGFGTLKILHNNHYRYENYGICGTRGWVNGTDGSRDVQDEKVLKREVQRLETESAVLPWEEYEKRIIAKALKQCGSFNAAAKELKITHKTVAAKARKYGLA